jgi:uncharacterized protein (TIGR03437 family)
MKTTVSFLGILAVMAVSAVSSYAQQPTAAAVVNAASYAVAGTQNSPIAEGSLFIVFGTNMGPSAIQHAYSFPLPTNLAGTSINVTVNALTSHAIMLYSSAGQLAAILPSSTPVGTGVLTVIYNSLTSATLPITVVASSFGSFSANQAGSGAGIVVDGNGNAYTALRPATPGSQVALYGTGLGPISGDETQPTPQQQLNVSVAVYVGAISAPVVFAGRAGAAGNAIDQINFTVPSGASGCNVPVAVQIGNVVSNWTTMAVSASGPCSDPSGVPSSVISGIPAGGNVTIGSVFLDNSTTTSNLLGNVTSTTTTGGGAFFASYALNQYLASPSTSSGTPSVGGCLVSAITSSASSATSPIVLYTGLDAGPSISVNGPNGAQSLPKLTTAALAGFYSDTFPASYLVAGAYTATGPGGANVGPFTASLTVPNPLIWTNAAALTTVNRSQGITVNWAGGSGGYVIISGESTSLTSNSSVIGGLFTCLAPGSAQTFTVPAAVLLSLPASTSIAGFALPGSLSVASETYVPFTASGLTFGVFGYSNSTGQSVTYQ